MKYPAISYILSGMHLSSTPNYGSCLDVIFGNQWLLGNRFCLYDSIFSYFEKVMKRSILLKSMILHIMLVYNITLAC